MKAHTIRKSMRNDLTSKQRKMLEKAARHRIDFTDMPETVLTSKARRGLFYRPRKMSITIRIDEDLLAYYRARAPEGRYQTEINRVLREKMTRK